MRTLLLTALATALLLGFAAAPTNAQAWQDDFGYGGSVMGNWLEYNGDWTAVNNRAEAAHKGLTHQYATYPSISPLHGVIQCVVMINTASTLKGQVGGVTFRTNDPVNSTDMITLTCQDRAGNHVFNGVSITRRGPSANRTLASKLILPPSQTVTVRLMMVDFGAYAVADGDGDGVWDYYMIGNAASLPVRSGPIGIQGHSGVFIDDVKYYSGVLIQKEVAPKAVLGYKYKIPMRATPNKSYQVACSWTTNGIPLGGGKWLPLWMDNLFWASISGNLPQLFVDFKGTTDANGDAEAGVQMPVIPPIVGLHFYTAFVTYDPTGILDVSNEVRATIVQF